MGGIFQLIDLAPKALAIYATLMVIGFLAGRLFKSRKIRRRILLGITAICLASIAVFAGLVLFILSGCLNC